ncbi:MAG: serine/threonine-protein kinase [Armatimonas sp.]
MTLSRGDELPGGLRADSPIGQGGMAEVWRVWNARLGRWEALKVLLASAQGDIDLVERFLDDARIAAGLRHPHIIGIYSVSGALDRPSFFTMELVEGGDLAGLMRNLGQVPLPEALRLLSQAASALDFAHSQNVIHRDIKPGNILLTNEGDVRVSDFGIARAATTARGKTQAGMVIGTPDYMSPEQADGRATTAASDQYSLAVVAYELLTGVNPFRHAESDSVMTILLRHAKEPPPSPRTLNPNLPPSVEAALLRGLAKDPAERFGSCAEFIGALTASATVTPAPPAAPPKPLKAAWIIAAVATMAGITLVGYGIARSTSLPPEPTPPQSSSSGLPTPEPTPTPQPLPEVTYERYTSSRPPYLLKRPEGWDDGNFQSNGQETSETLTSPDGKIVVQVQFTSDDNARNALANMRNSQKYLQEHGSETISEPAEAGTLDGKPCFSWKYIKNKRYCENTGISLSDKPAPQLSADKYSFLSEFVGANIICSAPTEEELVRWKPVFDTMKENFKVRYDIERRPRPTPAPLPDPGSGGDWQPSGNGGTDIHTSGSGYEERLTNDR